MSEIDVSVGQAMAGMQAAFTNDAIRQEGRLALQMIESVAPPQQSTQSASTPSERIGQNINTSA